VGDAIERDEGVFRDFAPMEFLIHCARSLDMMHPGAWLAPQSVLQRAGPWDESLTLNDDGEYFARVLLASEGIAFVAGPCSYYRSGIGGSLSRRRDAAAARSQFRSIELICGHMLRSEDTPRVRKAAADYYQRYVYDFYPAAPELIGLAERRIEQFGGSDLRPPMGPLTAAAARFVGWKATWRIKRTFIGSAARSMSAGPGERK
jgi:hypothetical protein